MHCINDTGLSKQDVAEIKAGWDETMYQVSTTVQQHNAFSWQMFRTIDPPNSTTCEAWTRQACAGAYVNSTMLMQFSKNADGNPFPLPSFMQDLTSFLLARGPYAWLGYSWLGCSSGNEPPGAGAPPAHGPYAFPSELKGDYGEPLEVGCKEVSQGVFQREWSKATVSMNCNTFQGTITPK